MSEFKIGDVVKLKSGSPDLLVVALESDDQMVVAWFNAVTGTFDGETIREIFLVKGGCDE